MKKILLATLPLLSVLTIEAQNIKEKDLPVSVKDAFTKAYPQVKQASWEKENANFEAEFELSKKEHSVLIDPSGKILETEMEIPIAELPSGIIAYVTKNYKNESIKEAAKISDHQNAITYEVELKGMDLIFNDKGAFLREDKK